MIKFLSLSSGSNGNCYYLGNEDSAILIDAGIGWRTIKKRLLENGLLPDSISSILVTHDHIDHIKYLGTIIKNLSIPVYATSLLHDKLVNHPCTKGMIGGCKRVIKKEHFFQVNGANIVAFGVPHDATETVGYYINYQGIKLVIITDLGDIPDYVVDYCKDANHLVVESNFDSDMLISGNYPAQLKKRIFEGRGHLSNDQCASLLKRAYHQGLSSICLCHLSAQNNTPQLAYNCAREALNSLGVEVGKDVKLYCLPRNEASPVFEY